jgi:hypothetical protein
LKKMELELLESSCDYLVIISNLIGTQIPGKLYYYSGTIKKILVGFSSSKCNLATTACLTVV